MQRRLVAACLGGIFLFAVPTTAQISPGPLADSHSDLEGSGNCLKCHTRGEGVEPSKCLSCHQPLQQRIERGTGLHAAVGYEACKICHIDHHGRSFDLIYWGDQGVEEFDHTLTGYPLKGGHLKIDCRDCHRSESVVDPGPLVQTGKKLNRTYLGLSPECNSCHADTHQTQFGSTPCDSCHLVDGWKPASQFDHDQSNFVLSGGHQEVACNGCHDSENSASGDLVTRFKPVQHRLCSDCHADPHSGSLGAECMSCHGTSSWSAIIGFDHDRTNFPLTGGHRQAACSGCHRNQRAKQQYSNIAHAACTDCHSDPHENRLSAECKSCHTTLSWAEIAPEAFNHEQTNYPLEGSHQNLECVSCHRVGEPLRITGFERCGTCHVDTHLGQFTHLGSLGECATCHNVNAFLPAHFSLEDHQQSRFPLTGLHQAIPCLACHQEAVIRSSDGRTESLARKFLFDDLTCSACHRDPHQGSADTWLAQDGCSTCHTTAAWNTTRYDHNATEFPLEGMHLSVPCSGCHAENLTAQQQTEGQYPLRLAATPKECASCHQDIHLGQFSGRAGACQSCHASTSWQDLSFDHNRDARFPLEGAHAAASCASCHFFASQNEPVRYAPLPILCNDCHSQS